MPPPKGSHNPLAGPADYDMTKNVHSDTYPAIQSVSKTHAGKAILITGASKGLGQAMAISFAKSGASKIAIGARGSLDETSNQIRDAAMSLYGRSPEILSLQLDVTDAASVASAESRVRNEFGQLDIMINNAAIVTRGLIAESDPLEWQKTLQVNLIGPYLMTRAFIPLLLEQGDKTIINVSSVGAHCTTKTYSAYETSKLAVLRLTEFACVEYGSQGLLAYSIHPGNVPTNINGGVEGIAPEMKHVFVETPQLSADALAYLTREKRVWLAGRYINVTWDLPELMAKEREIVEKDMLKVRMVV